MTITRKENWEYAGSRKEGGEHSHNERRRLKLKILGKVLLQGPL